MSDAAATSANGPTGVELRFPIEFFIVDEIPISLSASSSSKAKWKQTVEAAARAVIDASSWATDKDVSVTIYYFPDGRMQGDIDNVVKPILDAMNHFIYMNDHQVERVLVQKFEPDRPRLIADNPTATLASALESDLPVLYVRIDDDGSLGA